MRHFVLWDIDGTLVQTGGSGREAFEDAFSAVFGRPVRRLVAMAGRTDHEIALELLELNDVKGGDAHLDAFSKALHTALAAKRDIIRRHGRALPGAPEALEALAREPGVLQSLLTGNIEPNAAVKLSAFGLERHLDLEVGGYGSDHRMRPHLVDIARGKARRKHGVDFAPEDTVLVGDTPLDVAAGREGGARVVAVASGASDEDELRAAGADVVLPDLRDTRRVLDAVLERSGSPA
jgi:phosphoglycolate phosphatase-like HAD superfamily hydrolase